ncbi:hypothetical protein Airi02_094220 [Actinoallomurus iriomotensis]|uniref:Uncharacterized protein n=1 Tax=Actinoallomurus iriomotensis TaxID=478107 RepID=A0A9W6VZR9_9ACTN|nr:hypothetical protein Airi02_094220 [Actinoallomurus iriomotensis]
MAQWFRVAGRIEAQAGAVVPGPPVVEPLPDRSTDPADAGAPAEGRPASWRSLVGAAPGFPRPARVAGAEPRRGRALDGGTSVAQRA